MTQNNGQQIGVLMSSSSGHSITSRLGAIPAEENPRMTKSYPIRNNHTNYPSSTNRSYVLIKVLSAISMCQRVGESINNYSLQTYQSMAATGNETIVTYFVNRKKKVKTGCDRWCRKIANTISGIFLWSVIEVFLYDIVSLRYYFSRLLVVVLSPVG